MRKPIVNTLIDELVAEAVALSTRRVGEGGIPFAALVVDHRGEILGRGVNQVKEDHDPTAHAEVVAIREACRHRQSAQLNGSVLIASGEPCALCYMAALYTGIGKVVFAADREEAAQGGFDYRSSYRLFNQDLSAWPLERRHHRHLASGVPFAVWRERHPDMTSAISVSP